MSESRKSIMTNHLCRCYWCGSTVGLEMHHVFGGSRRKLSDEDKLIIPLCRNCHTGNYGVHFNKDMADEIHKEGQKKWESHFRKSTEDFIERYGRNYL